MKTSITLAFIFTMLVFIGKTEARPDRRRSSLLTDEDLAVDPDLAETYRHSGSGRRTRHSRQIFSGYSHPYSFEPFFENRVLQLLEEYNMKLKLISEQLSSRPTSYPIYIPYPYPYPSPFNMENVSVPMLNGRFSGPVWGVVGGKAQTPSDDEDDDGLRPISLKPSKQNIPAGVRAPPVEHGSIQGEKSSNPSTPKPQPAKIRTPTICEAAVINCCRFSEPERRDCFDQMKCSKTYATGKACLPQVIDMVIKVFTDAYKPR